MAILRYKGAPDDDPSEEETLDRQGLTVNPWNERRSNLNIPYVALNSTGIRNHILNTTAQSLSLKKI